jgi:hypothetical protein
LHPNVELVAKWPRVTLRESHDEIIKPTVGFAWCRSWSRGSNRILSGLDFPSEFPGGLIDLNTKIRLSLHNQLDRAVLDGGYVF